MRSLILAALAALSLSAHTVPTRFEPEGRNYSARSGSYRLTVGDSASTLEWKGTRVSMRLAGAAAREVEPLDVQPGVTNYLTGPSEGWRTGVSGYDRVRQRGVYPGIDLIFHASAGSLEYDFVVAPGGDPARIRLDFRGQRGLKIDASGDLVIATVAGEIRWKKPELYQTSHGKRLPVAGRFVIAGGGRVGFAVGEYDRSKELVIDPTLAYSTLLGGAGNDGARGIAVDPSGNVYIGGSSNSDNLPVTAALQTAFGGMTANFGGGDGFIAKFGPDGKLIYLTYLGGSGDDAVAALAVDTAGNVYATGMTSSGNFPTANAFQPTFGGNAGRGLINTGDAFVVKLNAAGNRLLYSTFLGGSSDDMGLAIAIDPAGAAYVAGATQSLNFPTSDTAYSRVLRGTGGQPPIAQSKPFLAAGDAFVAKLSPGGQQLMFSTLLGGSADDAALSIAVDSQGNVYAGGYTLSSDFPTTSGAYQRSFGGIDDQNFFVVFGDGWMAKLNPTGTALVYSTLFGGRGDEQVNAIAVDSTGALYVAGSSSSNNLRTTPGAFQMTYKGYTTLPFEVEHLFGDAFVGKLNPAGSAFNYLTYLGGSFNDAATAIAIDSAGNAYIAGVTNSTDFPMAGTPLQTRIAGDGPTNYHFGDAFLSVVDPSGSLLLYSSYFGARYDDGATGIAIDGKGKVYLAGMTYSPNFPVTGDAVQTVYAGGQTSNGYGRGDAFYAVFSDFPLNPPVLSAITNAASNASQPVSPGMIYVAYGTGMGPTALAGAALDGNGRLASTVADSQMLFDNAPAPIVYTSAGQFAGVVPYSVAGKSSVQVVSVYKGAKSAPLTVPVGTAAPGLFSANYSGTGQAAAFNADGTPNSQSNPAPKGSIVVFYGTGEGAITPAVPDGTVAGAPPSWRLTQGSGVTVGGTSAAILYINTAPFSVAGLLQINAQLHPDTPSGNQPVVVTIGNTKSQSGLNIWVR